MKKETIETEFIKILQEELMPAMGCTEPIALAYGGAKGREILGGLPDKVHVFCSGNMIKNVRCVSIPNSGNMVGIESGVMLGIVAGDAKLEMEVLKNVTKEQRELTKKMVEDGVCKVEFLDSNIPLHIILELYKEDEKVSIEIKYTHTNITKIKKGNNVLLETKIAESEISRADRSLLSIENIKNFADEIDISKVQPLLDKVIMYNMNIAYEGMTGTYGLGLGTVIKNSYIDDVTTRMKSYTAAASEARMAGCDMPVMINSGSGNQGISSTVPVIVYAREMNIGQEKLYRALIFSSLLTVFQKESIGKLSAFCGAVSASCASGAAVTYLAGGTLQQIKYTIENVLANIPGIICDGAKISCAAKIASSIDAAMMAHYLAMNHKAYEANSGILKQDAGDTISCVGYIGREGMRQTDKEIIKIMLEK